MFKNVFKFLLFLILVTTSCASAQSSQIKADTLLPYQKYPALPAFQIRKLDSIAIINTYNIIKGKPTIFILFSPDCGHCEKLTRMVLENIDSFKTAKIYMVSPMPLYQIKQFVQENGLNKYKQITVGQDISYFFWSFFRADTVPFIVVYDKNKQLVQSLGRIKKIDELLHLLHRALQ
jgi:thioredoxin-related protein